MNVLYLSEISALEVTSLEEVLGKFVAQGVNPTDLKDMIKSIDLQGFFIGSCIFGSYAVINLNLSNFTISVLPKGKTAYEGVKKTYTHI